MRKTSSAEKFHRSTDGSRIKVSRMKKIQIVEGLLSPYDQTDHDDRYKSSNRDDEEDALAVPRFSKKHRVVDRNSRVVWKTEKNSFDWEWFEDCHSHEHRRWVRWRLSSRSVQLECHLSMRESFVRFDRSWPREFHWFANEKIDDTIVERCFQYVDDRNGQWSCWNQ